MTKPDNAVALHVLENLGFERQSEVTFEGTVYTAFVEASPQQPLLVRSSACVLSPE